MGENDRNRHICNKNDNVTDDKRCTGDKNSQIHKESVSMETLIVWNISKALEKNPTIDLKQAIKTAEDRLERSSRDVNMILSQQPEEKHIACALLAWQQLGHNDADSLYRFYETKRIQKECSSNTNKKDTGPRSYDFTRDPKCLGSNQYLNYTNGSDSASFRSSTIGPVVKLPERTKIVMRMENAPSARQMSPKQQKGQDKDIMNKIDAACCLESGCVERLLALDAITNELRTRASKLARREAERVELLERAEAAWKDLELGYQRRLTLAEEKEEDVTKQIQKIIEERNGYKDACTMLAQQLRSKGDAAEKDRTKLSLLEKEVCEKACVRLRLSEEAARGDALLAETQCKTAQLDRDLQFKEEQARRKLFSLESEAESARALTHDAERAMRAELGALREQIAQVSNELLEEDAENNRIKLELDELRMEKMGMVEDLEGCKVMCDNRMQGRVDELKKKRDQLNELKEQVMECRCKLPVDATVEAKRTPSLAALCRCTPEDKLLDSCSCTSLRSRLLSNLLSDLFGGLQAELGGSGYQMPCQLLKCLEDKHNWDRASIVKTNLRNFFSQLLIGELDIAIATSIEKYHAKWVGASCADEANLTPEPDEVQNEGWQERALERRAQKLATQLAEQLFQERADQLTQRAKEIVTAGPPPCECKPKPQPQPAVYPVLVKTPPAVTSGAGAPSYWKRTMQDVTQLRLQIENLKKDSIKKQDLQIMEDNIAKILQQSSGFDCEELATSTMDNMRAIQESSKLYRKDTKSARTNEKELSRCYVTIPSKFNCSKTRQLDMPNSIRKGYKSSFNQNIVIDKSSKSYKKQTYSVNMCLCSTQKDSNKITQHCKLLQNPINNDDKATTWKQKPSKLICPQISSNIKQIKPINTQIQPPVSNILDKNKISTQASCGTGCVCFHKIPSNTSIDKLLETLTKWKCDLAATKDERVSDEYNISTSIENTDQNKQIDNKTSGNNAASEKHVGETNDIKVNDSSEIENKKECSTSCDGVDNNIIKSIGFENTVPGTTESEYMGAVNLDKSNDNICKCIKNYENKAEIQMFQSIDASTKFPYKCINSNQCDCKKSHQSKEIKPITQVNSQNHELSGNNSEYESQILQNEVKEDPKVIRINKSSIISKNSQSVKNKNSQKSNSLETSQNKLFPCDCDYCIKFLGVTLINTDSPKKPKVSIKDDATHVDDDFSYEETNRSDKKNHFVNKPSKDLDYVKQNKYDINEYDVNSSHNKLSSADNVNKNEIKQSTNNQKGDNSFANERTDVSLNMVRKESCVCCIGTNSDDSKDLEENAFHLLQEHLKEQLKEFKTSSCQSSCIPREQEEKIFTTILQKVKQVISDSTKQVSCKCSGKQQTKGSWNRAFGLLQEYLKIKMKRVQCLCVSIENKDTASPVLDDVMSRVCDMIQGDFERLKNICTCNNIEPDQIPSPEETPVKDIDNSTGNNQTGVAVGSSCSKMSKQNSNESIIITQNISSQVPPNLGMQTKSCNAMEKGTKNIQTTNCTPLSQNYKSTNYASDCNCCSFTKPCNIPHSGIIPNEILISRCTDFAKKEDMDIIPLNINNSSACPCTQLDVCNKTSSEAHQNIETKHNTGIDIGLDDKQIEPIYVRNHPYIGYTINCSCDGRLGSCVCMKSVIRKNTDKITNIWKTFIENNDSCVRNISYILNSSRNNRAIPSYMENKTNFVDITIPTEEVNMQNIIKNSIHHRDTEVSVNCEEDIVLKESKCNLEGITNTTITIEENASMSTDYSNTEDTLDWYECGSHLHKPQDIIGNDGYGNSMYFPAPIDEYQKRVTEAILAEIHTSKLPNAITANCDCDMVPICHVKLLVENIEDKLVHCKCTCDSLIPKVCPIHSSKIC